MNDTIISQLARTINLRDLGGAATRGGGTVKRGHLYRSATLSALSPEERAAMRTLGIRSICDLRHNGERDRFPTPWEDIGCTHYWFHDHSRTGDLHMFLDRMKGGGGHDYMIGVYRELPFNHLEALKGVFRTVVTREGGVLFHCAAGKDRTGAAAALLLTAVDVPRETILADYLATAAFDVLASPAFQRDTPYGPEQLEALRPIIAADARYLEAMFAAIADREGSVDNFLRRGIGLTDADFEKLRSRLVA